MFYGIDLHSESFKAARIAENSSDTSIVTVSLKDKSFKNFLSTLTQEDYIAVEASTNTFWFVDQVKDKVKECHVVNPYKFSTIANSNKKTDTIDATKLGQKLKYHICFDQSPYEFPTVYVPPKEVSELRSMFVTYGLLKKQVCQTKNRIRSLLRQNAIFEFSGKDLSTRHVQKDLLEFKTGAALKIQLTILMETLQFQEGQKEAIQLNILNTGKIFDKEIRLLTSIRGISPFLAIAIMSDIVDINRFPNAKKLCSYLRTAPKIDASGTQQHVGKVNKQSRTLTTSLMTESVKHFVDSSEQMHRFYFEKRKGKSAGKVRVAVMRKIIVIIYNMLKNNELYNYVDEKKHEAKLKKYYSSIAA